MKNKLLVFAVLVLYVLPFLSADVLSLNSGGDDGLIINPGADIEGFFLGSVCGDGSCDSGAGETCATCVSDCACASGYTCTGGTCVADEGGDGGGGGGGSTTPPSDLEITPTSFNIQLAVNTNTKRSISITNTGSTSRTLSVSQDNLDDKVILSEESVTVEPDQTYNLEVIFVAPAEEGIYTGKIYVGGFEIPVSLNVKTKLLLFDSNIVVLNKDYLVGKGDKLKTKVELIPMGDPERLDVTLNYAIKDYDGEIYLTKSETLLVEKQIDFKRNFDTGSLPLGQYIIGLELIYPNGVAPSSAHFEVVERTPHEFLSKILFYLILMILIIAILIILLLMKRKRDAEKQQGM